MREPDRVSRREYEAATELKRVLPEAVLAVPRLPGAAPGRRVAAAKEVQQRGLPQPCGTIGAALLVDEQRKPDPGLLTERPRVLAVAEPDGRHASACGAEGLLVLAQLRDVLPAEDSAVVPEEDEDGGAGLPKGPEPDLASVDIR